MWQRVTLVSRKKQQEREKSRILLEKSVSRLQSLSLSSLLDATTEAHKKDIDILTTGYLNPNNLHDKLFSLLEEHDAVSVKTRNTNATKVVQPTDEATNTTKTKRNRSRLVPQDLPNQYLHTTKADQYKTLRNIDKVLVEKDYLQNNVTQHFYRMQQELEGESDSLSRLNVYSKTFEIIITEFKTYGPLLASIKKVYDDTIAGYRSEQEQLAYLRNKVTHLLSKNENRLLLKVEKKKVARLEQEISDLLQQQEKLKKDTFRKLSIYSAYVPEQFVQLDDNAELKESISKIRESIQHGVDPLTCLENQVLELQEKLEEKTGEIQELKSSISKNYVLKASKDLVDESLLEVKEKLQKVLDENKAQEFTLKGLNAELEKLKGALRDKEGQYDVLSREYQELSEAAAISFDRLLES